MSETEMQAPNSKGTDDGGEQPKGLVKLMAKLYNLLLSLVFKEVVLTFALIAILTPKESVRPVLQQNLFCVQQGVESYVRLQDTLKDSGQKLAGTRQATRQDQADQRVGLEEDYFNYSYYGYYDYEPVPGTYTADNFDPDNLSPAQIKDIDPTGQLAAKAAAKRSCGIYIGFTNPKEGVSDFKLNKVNMQVLQVVFNTNTTEYPVYLAKDPTTGENFTIDGILTTDLVQAVLGVKNCCPTPVETKTTVTLNYTNTEVFVVDQLKPLLNDILEKVKGLETDCQFCSFCAYNSSLKDGKQKQSSLGTFRYSDFLENFSKYDCNNGYNFENDEGFEPLFTYCSGVADSRSSIRTAWGVALFFFIFAGGRVLRTLFYIVHLVLYIILVVSDKFCDNYDTEINLAILIIAIICNLMILVALIAYGVSMKKFPTISKD